MSKPRTLLFAALALTCLSSPPELPGQPQASRDQTIRLKTDLLEVRAVVTDRKGNPVDNLKKEDFELLEDGRPQNISFFSLEQIDSARNTRAQSGKSGVPGASRAVPSQKPSRTIVIFVDNLHITPPNLQSVKAGLKRFVDEQVTDRDLVSLVMSTGSLGLLGQFTRDRHILHYAIERISAVPREETLFTSSLAAGVERGERDAMAAAIEILRSESGLAFGSPGITGDVDTSMLRTQATAKAREILMAESYRRRVMLLTLKAVVERLAEMDGQRVLAFLSDGFTMMDQNGSVNAFDVQAATSSAVRAGVTIYSIHTAGLEPPAIFSASSPALSPGSFVLVDRALNESPRELRDGMNALAGDTGGEMFANTNDLNGALKKALDANSAYYTLAYYPASESVDKQFHKLVVRVRNHPEYTVRAQKGFFTAKSGDNQATVVEGPRDRLFQAMAAPLPATTIPVAASADYVESEADEAQVTLQVHIDGDSLEYKSEGAERLLNVELAKVIFDLKGKPVANSIDSVRWNVSERLDLAKRSGYLYTERVPLKPGFYEFRIGVREPATGKVGTAIAWVEVPNITKGKIALSNIDLSRRVTSAERTAGVPSSPRFVGPKHALGIKFYRSGDALIYRVMVYNAKKPSEAMIKPEIRQEDHLVYEGEWQALISRLIRTDRKGIEAGGQIALNGVRPGIYQLSVLVKASKSGSKTRQVIVFGVEP